MHWTDDASIKIQIRRAMSLATFFLVSGKQESEVLSRIIIAAMLSVASICRADAKTCSDVLKGIHSPDFMALMQSNVPVDPSNLSNISPNGQPLKFTTGQMMQTMVAVCVVDAANGQGDIEAKDAMSRALVILENFAALSIDPLN